MNNLYELLRTLRVDCEGNWEREMALDDGRSFELIVSNIEWRDGNFERPTSNAQLSTSNRLRFGGRCRVWAFFAGEWGNFKWGLRLRMVRQELVLIRYAGNNEH
jgi:hypothetical protein